MQIFGFQIGRTKAAVPAMSFANTNGAFGGGWFGVIRESFAGAFQSGVTVDAPKSLLSNSSVWACSRSRRIDVAKLGCGLVVEDKNGICAPAPKTSPFWAGVAQTEPLPELDSVHRTLGVLETA
jgi:hypothetical protein